VASTFTAVTPAWAVASYRLSLDILERDTSLGHAAERFFAYAQFVSLAATLNAPFWLLALLPFAFLLRGAASSARIGAVLLLGGLFSTVIFHLVWLVGAMLGAILQSALPLSLSWIVTPFFAGLLLDPDLLIRHSASKLGHYWLTQLAAGPLGLTIYWLVGRATEMRAQARG
jgi:hypothetical protein